MADLRAPQHILITGASSGIGAALAHCYARPGVRLALSGRDEARLGDVASNCATRGAVVDQLVVDVTDRAAMAHWIGALTRDAPLDLVIANAGVGASTSGMSGGPQDSAVIHRIMATNIDGVFNTILPALAAMRARGQGQLALMSSLAAYLPLPGMAPYAASKAAIKSYGLALRVELARAGIGVSVICPGYVRSRLTDGSERPLPFLMETEVAARLIQRRLACNPALIAFPWQMHAASWFAGALPSRLLLPILSRATRHT